MGPSIRQMISCCLSCPKLNPIGSLRSWRALTSSRAVCQLDSIEIYGSYNPCHRRTHRQKIFCPSSRTNNWEENHCCKRGNAVDLMSISQRKLRPGTDTSPIRYREVWKLRVSYGHYHISAWHFDRMVNRMDGIRKIEQMFES